jgi:hypothetical protein
VEPVHWFFVGLAAWGLIMGFLLRLNYKFHEWQKKQTRCLFHPECGGKEESKE